MLQIDLQGLDQVQHRLQTVVRQMITAAPGALYEEGNRIMGVSVGLVPVDTGLLRSTAHVEQPMLDGQGVSVELSYGSHGTAEYAAIIEFDTSMNHPNGGQSHFLSEPFFAATAGMAARLAAAIHSNMGG